MLIKGLDKSVFEPIQQSTLSEIVANRLVSLLSNGHLKPGDRLPPERELALQLNVGRTTVREALKLLTLGGLLQAKRGHGTYVRRDFSSFLSQQIEWPFILGAEEVDKFVEVREALEAMSARLAAVRGTPEEIEKIGAFRDMLKISGRDVAKETALDFEFHHAVAVATHNELLISVILAMQPILRKYIDLSGRTTDRVETTVEEHQAIFEAIAAKRPDLAEQAMLAHLSMSRKWIMLAMNRARQTGAQSPS